MRVALFVVLIGCGGSVGTNTDVPSDSSITSETATATDSSPADSARADTAPADTTVDTSTVSDSATIDSTSDAGADTGTTSDAASSCGDKTCASSEICVRTYVTGGACLPCESDGSCPAGRKCGGACCVFDPPMYSYACKAKPSGCGAPLSCSTCGTSLCTGGCPCESASGSTMTCHCLAP